MQINRPQHLVASGKVNGGVLGTALVVLNINKAVAGGTATLYNGQDNGGTSMGVVALDTAQSFQYEGAIFDAGLYIALSGSSPDLTVVFG